MPTYVCRVGMGDGAIVTRAIEAPDERALETEVARLGARLFSAKLSGGEGAAVAGGRRSFADALSGFLPRRRHPVKTAEFLVFNQELVALLKAGLPIVNGFDILLERQENPRFKAILKDVRDQLVSGVALSDAFLSHCDVFLVAHEQTRGVARVRAVSDFVVEVFDRKRALIAG